VENSIEDKNIQTKSWTYSVVVYAALLLTLYFIKIAYEPPREEVAFGVDLNYGVDLIGSGDIQTTNKANASKNNYDVKPEAGPKVTTPPVETKPKPTPQPQKTVTKTNPPKVLTASEDTKVTVKTSPETAKPTTKSTAPATPAPTKTTTVTPTPAPRSVDNSSIMKKSSGSGGSGNSNGTTGTRDGIGGNNNGDGKPGEVGDKGDPRGTSVSISGWKNRGNLSISKDNSSETGTIVFDVVINDFGDVINIKNRATSLSPSVVGYYREQIRAKLKSTLQAEGTPPARSSGTITIRITRG
jgi:protein TonB